MARASYKSRTGGPKGLGRKVVQRGKSPRRSRASDAGPGRELVGLFDSGFDIAGQYSAEISTLIAMRLKRNKHVGLPAFLTAYASIVFLHGSNGDPTEVAARPARRCECIPGRRGMPCVGGKHLQDQLESLIGYLQECRTTTSISWRREDTTFAMALAHIYWLRSKDGWQLFYL
jgi:hypothetical protein